MLPYSYSKGDSTFAAEVSTHALPHMVIEVRTDTNIEIITFNDMEEGKVRS